MELGDRKLASDVARIALARDPSYKSMLRFVSDTGQQGKIVR